MKSLKNYILIFGVLSITQVESNKREQVLKDCVNFDDNICIGNNTLITHKSLRTTDTNIWAYFTFDNQFGLDMSFSGKNNLVFNEAALSQSVPSFGGLGTAQQVSDGKYIELDMSSFRQHTYSISFWLYLSTRDETNAMNLLLSFAQSIGSCDYQLFIQPDGQLRLKLCDQVTSINSNGKISFRQWTYVTINVLQNKEITLFLNSVHDFDLIVDLSEKTLSDYGTLFFGGDPWHSIGYSAFIDELMITSKTLSNSEINQQVRKVYAEPELLSLVHLGCKSTLISDIANCCSGPMHHICNYEEIMQGGYKVSKMMGWLNSKDSSKIFTQEQYEEGVDSGDKGLTLCCINNELH